jgi:hypothetical protein
MPAIAITSTNHFHVFVKYLARHKLRVNSSNYDVGLPVNYLCDEGMIGDIK